jgi:hypothetical protein
MGEYVAADDGPRETLLRNAKYERISRTLQYHNLRRAISSYLASPIRDGRILAACRAALEAERDAATHPQVRENFVYELRALDAFERSTNAMQIGGLALERAPIPRTKLNLNGVAVSVSPTVYVRVPRSRGGDLRGALIVDNARGIAPRTDEAQARMTRAMTATAILLHQYVADTVCASDERPSPTHCIVFHAFRQERVSAPSGYRRAFRNMEAACGSIARGWAAITPPPSFDPDRATYRP